jgi:hypothetical protein
MTQVEGMAIAKTMLDQAREETLDEMHDDLVRRGLDEDLASEAMQELYAKLDELCDKALVRMAAVVERHLGKGNDVVH